MSIQVRFQSTSSSRSSGPETIFLIVFGLPFLNAGLGVFVLGLSFWLTYADSASWEKVPATIVSAKVQSHRGSKGGTTYSIETKFTYSWNGALREGRRALIEEGSSSGLDYYKEKVDLLESHRGSGKPFTALVNPKDPATAILFREPSMGMYILPVFGLVFMMVGAGLSGFSLWNYLSSSKKAAMLRENPREPWRADEGGGEFRIPGGAMKTVLTNWVAAIGLNLFLSIFWFALWFEKDVPFVPLMIVGFFSLLGIFILGYSIYLTFRYFKYGDPVLLLSQYPIAIGDECSGAIVVKSRLVADEGVEVSFRCESALSTGSGKNRHTDVTVLHEEKAIIREDLARRGETPLLREPVASVSGTRSIIPFSFKVPAGLPQREPDANPRISWKIEATASTPGIDFAGEFELPVYKVGDLSLVKRRT